MHTIKSLVLILCLTTLWTAPKASRGSTVFVPELTNPLTKLTVTNNSASWPSPPPPACVETYDVNTCTTKTIEISYTSATPDPVPTPLTMGFQYYTTAALNGGYGFVNNCPRTPGSTPTAGSYSCTLYGRVTIYRLAPSVFDAGTTTSWASTPEEKNILMDSGRRSITIKTSLALNMTAITPSGGVVPVRPYSNPATYEITADPYIKTRPVETVILENCIANTSCTGDFTVSFETNLRMVRTKMTATISSTSPGSSAKVNGSSLPVMTQPNTDANGVVSNKYTISVISTRPGNTTTNVIIQLELT